MITKVRKWGNSLALRIPKHLAEDAHVANGSEVELSVKGDNLLISPVRPQRYRLAALLAQIKPGNVHGEINPGEPLGRELF